MRRDRGNCKLTSCGQRLKNPPRLTAASKSLTIVAQNNPRAYLNSNNCVLVILEFWKLHEQ